VGGVAPGLELVAVDGDDVVGHVLAGRGALAGREVIGIAPLAVAPSRQRRGVGSALMRALLAEMEEAGWPYVVLLGDPGYYGRFGFEPAGRYGIQYAAVGPDNPHFMIYRCSDAEPSARGNYTYCWEVSAPDRFAGPP
jgi:putative acetyltransferase